jgi:predicted GIY-YIG superfamily endonuclease
MSKKGAFLGGLTIGFFFRHWKETGAVLLFVYFVGVAWWTTLPEIVKALFLLTLIGLFALYVAYRMNRLPWLAPKAKRGRTRYRGEVDVVPGGLEWVYVITEWRGVDDCWLDRNKKDRDGRLHHGAVRHLVYIGVTNSLTHRLRQHAETKHWWHGDLMFEVVQYPNRAKAEAQEARWIGEASQKRALHLRPRENYEHNPSYDRKRSAYMHARRLETQPQVIAA